MRLLRRDHIVVMRRRCLLLIRTNLAGNAEVALRLEAGNVFHICVLQVFNLCFKGLDVLQKLILLGHLTA